MDLKVDGQRALRLQAGQNHKPSVISGSAANFVPEGTAGATIGGGAGNTNDFEFGTIGGGGNTASGRDAVAAGGLGNQAGADFSFAAGENSHAAHEGAFVWSDASFSGPLSSTTNNQFTVRAAGGVRFFTDSEATAGAELAPGSGTWSMLSDRNAKEHLTPVRPRQVLAKVAALPISTWNYKTQDSSIRHLGPMAQDFHAAFGLGQNDRTMTTIDADGVALASIQALLEIVREQTERLAANERKLAELRRAMFEMRAAYGAAAVQSKEGEAD